MLAMSYDIKTVIDWRFPEGHAEKIKVVPLTEQDYSDREKRISDEAAKKVDPNFYVENRVNEYPTIGDQMDAIMKWLASSGDTNIPQNLKDIANNCMAVKLKYPKKEA